MSVTVKLNSSNFKAKSEQAAQRAVQLCMGELSAAFQQSFTAKAWHWPRNIPTRKLRGATLAERFASYQRGEGIAPGNPRNIIDTANLRQTHSWMMNGPYEAIFKWSARYATAVHEGAHIYPWGNKKAKLVYLPPRPWCRATLGLENVDGVVVYKLNERLKNVWMAYSKAGR